MFRAISSKSRRARDSIALGCGQLQQLTGTVEIGFLTRSDDIRRRRKELLKLETAGTLVLNEFVQLYIEADRLNDDVQSALRALTPHRSRLGIFWHATKRRAWAIVGGVALGVLACIAFAIMAPDATKFGWQARKLLHLPGEAAAAQPLKPVANIPSTSGKLGAPTPPAPQAGTAHH